MHGKFNRGTSEKTNSGTAGRFAQRLYRVLLLDNTDFLIKSDERSENRIFADEVTGGAALLSAKYIEFQRNN